MVDRMPTQSRGHGTPAGRLASPAGMRYDTAEFNRSLRRYRATPKKEKDDPMSYAMDYPIAAQAGCTVAQYTPNEVKQAVAGYGAAPKEQVQRMVQALLGLAEPPRPADAADALALALCHLAMAPLRAKLARAAGAR